jgi:hypothetical protein
MHSRAPRWKGAFNRAQVAREGLQTLQDELSESLLDGHSAEAEETIALLRKKGYSPEQISEFLASQPKPEPL